MSMKILGANGEPVEAPKPSADIKPDTPLTTRAIEIESGPLKIKTTLEFEGVTIGGTVKEFVSALDAVLTRNAALALRLCEFMLVGAQKGVKVSPIVLGALEDLKLMRGGIEGMAARVAKGLDPIPTISVARAKGKGR